MRVGVGLPTTVPGADGQLIIEWARTADAGPFSSLGVLDRLVYDSYDPLISLTAAAAVTQRVLLATTIVIGPLHSTAILAKAAASLDALSGGRFVLGLAVGARKEDYDAAGVDYHSRGKRLEEQLAEMRDLWETRSQESGVRSQESGVRSQESGEDGAEEMGPGLPVIAPTALRRGGPPILVGGLSDVGFARMARYADGYVHGGGPPRAFARAADKARAAWLDAGRPGKPQLWAQGYFALGGEDVAEAGTRYLQDYYAFTGPFAERIAAGLLTTPQAIAGFIRGYQEAGCDELVLFPTLPNLNQVAQLAQIIESNY
jgi:alkanesulfonate monooxygenase SsuD/methylene tetrahydromethanopterin reductase-like flavin-dependent oxidoreductase (luciferase family)